MSCARCKKASLSMQKSYNVPSGCDVLLLRLRPTEQEVLGKTNDALEMFRGAVAHVLKRDLRRELVTAFVVRCPQEPVRIAHVRNCEPELTALITSRPWRCIIAAGSGVLRFALMRGSTPPSMTVMLGMPVRVRDYGGQTVITIPPPEDLLNLTGDANNRWYDPAKELLDRRKAMEKGLLAVKKYLGGST